ncbi:MAG TPA: hypothetical protein PLS50_08570 [Candidatus Dojkabacteria bacterium]|nr:hypothetical protein [Candidatus Dojkabacteria bacterium]
MNENKKISGGFAIAAQVFVPFNAIVAFHTISANITFDKMIFLLCCLIPSSFIVYKAFTTVDVYISGSELIIEKLFSRKERSAKDVKKIGRGLIPFTYYLEFADGGKIIFVREINGIIKDFLSPDADYMKQLRDEIYEAKKVD